MSHACVYIKKHITVSSPLPSHHLQKTSYFFTLFLPLPLPLLSPYATGCTQIVMNLQKASHTPGAIHWNEIKIMSMTPSINIDIVSSEQDNCFVLWVSIQCAYIALRSNVWATNRRVIMSNTGRDSSLATSA